MIKTFHKDTPRELIISHLFSVTDILVHILFNDDVDMCSEVDARLVLM